MSCAQLSPEPVKMEYEVINTFIQFPVERTSSLEQFLQPRSAVSCPASRMVSMEEEPEHMDSSPINDMLIQWPATRGPSIDDEDDQAVFSTSEMQHVLDTLSQWPATRGPSLEEDPWSTNTAVQWPATRGPSLEEFIEAKQQDPLVFAGISREEEAVAWPTTRGSSPENEFVKQNPFPMFPNPEPPTAMPPKAFIEDLRFMQWAPMQGSSFASKCVHGTSSNEISQEVKSQSIFQELLASEDASTAVSGGEETPPVSLSDDEADKDCYPDQSGSLKISLTDSLGLWSVGSSDHSIGTCKPCAFLWKDPLQPGCQNGRECIFCHLCPPGEVKRRKKEKKVLRKMNRGYRWHNQVSSEYENMYQDQFQVCNGFEGSAHEMVQFSDPYLPNYQTEVATQFGEW